MRFTSWRESDEAGGTSTGGKVLVTKYSERRHRLNYMEIDPVKDACYHRLLYLLEERAPEGLLEASILFRIFHRIQTHCHGKPAYPDHDTWEAIAANILTYGTISREEETGEE